MILIGTVIGAVAGLPQVDGYTGELHYCSTAIQAHFAPPHPRDRTDADLLQSLSLAVSSSDSVMLHTSSRRKS